jgi:uncharacterized protein (TIGR04255 family)
VEVICQVAFAQPVAWSVATPGVLFKALEDEYPAEPKSLASVAASFDRTEGEFTVNPQNRFVFSNDEQGRRLVANESCLSVNALRPYEEWPSVADRFRRAVDTFSKSVGAFSPASVSLRYINRIIIPEDQLDVSEYFKIPLVHAHQDNAVIQGFLSRSQSMSPETSISTTITFASAEHPVADESAFILDIELEVPTAQDASVDDLIDAIEELHRRENLEFESSITPKCRELFK